MARDLLFEIVCPVEHRTINLVRPALGCDADINCTSYGNLVGEGVKHDARRRCQEGIDAVYRHLAIAVHDRHINKHGVREMLKARGLPAPDPLE